MGAKQKSRKASQQAPAMSNDNDIDDGFTVVGPKQKAKQPEWRVKVKPVVPVPSSKEVQNACHDSMTESSDLASSVAASLNPAESISPMYHPDFARIRSPSDVLIKTSDGILFWFSLSLLSHHSPRFALLDPETLWLTRRPLDFSTVVTVSAIDSRAFAIIAHTLLHDYHAVQKSLYLELPIVGAMPAAIVDAGVVDALRLAILFAKDFGMESFISMAGTLIAEHVDQLLLIQTYFHYDTGSQLKRLLGL